MAIDFSTLATIIDVAFIVFIFLTILFGFLKGLRKSLRSFIAVVIGVVIVILLLNPMTNIALNENIRFLVSEDITLREYIIKTLSEAISADPTTFANSATYDLANGLAYGIVRLAIYAIGMLLAEIVLIPIIKLIIRLIFGKVREDNTLKQLIGKSEKPKKDLDYETEEENELKQENPHKKRNVALKGAAGAALALVEMIALFVLTLMPFFGVETLMMTYKTEIIALTSTEEKNPAPISTTNANSDIVDIYDQLAEFENTGLKGFINVISKISGKSVDVELFGKIAKVPTKNGDLNIPVELEKMQPLVSTIIEYQTPDGIDIMKMLKEKKDVFVDFISENKMFESVLPIAVEIYGWQQTNTEDSPFDFSKLEDIDWITTKQDLAELMELLIDFIIETDLDINDPVSAINNPKFVEAVGKLGTDLSTSKFADIFAETVTSLIQKALDSALSEDQKGLKSLVEIVDLTKIAKENWGKDFETLARIVSDLYQAGAFSEEGIDFSNGEVFASLVSEVFNLTNMKGQEATVIETLLNELGLKEALAKIDVNLDLANVDWETEPAAIGKIISAFFDLSIDIENFSLDELRIMIEHGGKQKEVEAFLGALCESKLAVDSLPSIINQFIEEAELTSWRSTWFNEVLNGTREISSADLLEEVSLIFDIISEVSSVDIASIDFINLSNEDLTKLLNALKKIDQSKMFTLEPLVGYLNDALVSIGLNDVTIAKANVPTDGNWASELDALAEILPQIAQLNTSEIDFNEAADLLELLDKSRMLKSLRPDFITYMIKQLGLTVNLDGLDLTKITNWREEMKVIDNIVTNYASIVNGETDFMELNSTSIVHIMKIAGGTVTEPGSFIVSYIIGDIIETSLLELFPKNTINVQVILDKYDFKQPSSLSKYALNIGNIIDFGNATNQIIAAFEANTITTNNALVFCQAFANLEVERTNNNLTFTDEFMIIMLNEYLDIKNEVGINQLVNVSYSDESTYLYNAMTAFTENKSYVDKISAVNSVNDNTIVAKAILNKIITKYGSYFVIMP